MGFLSDPKYMSYKGFQTADTAEPYFELMYLLFEADASLLRFRDSVGRQKDMPEGFVLYYTNQCPFTTFSLFYDGQFVTHEILSEKKFDKILADKGM